MLRIIIVSYLIVLLGCPYSSKEKENYSEQNSLSINVSQKLGELRSNFDESGQLSFDLFDLHGAKADSILIVGPYCRVEELKLTGIEFPKEVWSVFRTMQYSDFYNCLVWILDGKIVSYSLLDRQPFDFSPLVMDSKDLRFFNRSNSKVGVHSKIYGDKKYVYLKSKL